jgi:hypothetical protein
MVTRRTNVNGRVTLIDVLAVKEAREAKPKLRQEDNTRDVED